MTAPRPQGAVSIEEARAWREECSHQGARVVFTNGCFDVLHAGHVRLLEGARACGDALVVAINSDASVTRLKGEGRPIVPDYERAELLAALDAVDRVVIFADETPLATILALRPDVLVKGQDWSADAIVGAAEVVAWGGEVKRIPLVAGVSTSSIIARIAGAESTAR